MTSSHISGVAEQHHRVVRVEQFVLDAGVAEAIERLTKSTVLARSTSRIGMP